MSSFCISFRIEHLHPNTLSKLPEVVFGQLQPCYAIVSTPNSEYNVLFPNFTGFRHWDHKFEWTRKEFTKWCSNISKSYNYSVEYTGVGKPTPGFEMVGFCSQIAIFTRRFERQDKVVKMDPENLPYTFVSDSMSYR